jgi:hypothetical protein
MCRDGDALSKYGLGLGQEDTTRTVKLTLDDVYGERDSRGERLKESEERDCQVSADPGYDASVIRRERWDDNWPPENLLIKW